MAGGFVDVRFETLEARSRAATCHIPAIAYCQGTPLCNEIEARDPARLGEATSVAAARIAARFGRTDVDGRIRGHVITAVKPGACNEFTGLNRLVRRDDETVRAVLVNGKVASPRGYWFHPTLRIAGRWRPG